MEVTLFCFSGRDRPGFQEYVLSGLRLFFVFKFAEQVFSCVCDRLSGYLLRPFSLEEQLRQTMFAFVRRVTQAHELDTLSLQPLTLSASC